MMNEPYTSREVLDSELAAVHYMLHRAGYKQVLALRFRIGAVVYEKVAPEQLFIVRSVGMDPVGHILYYDNKQHPYYEEELEEAT